MPIHRSVVVGSPPSHGRGWELTTGNVGLASLGIVGANLPAYTGSYDVPANTTITDVRLTSPLDLSAGGITIERCLIRPTSVGRGMPAVTTFDYNQFIAVPAKVTIKDCDFDGGGLTQELSAWSVGFMGVADLINNYIHAFGTGINLMNTGTFLDALVEHNYVTGLTAYGNPATDGNHSDAFTVRDCTAVNTPGRQFIIRNNRFNCASGNDTGAFFVQAQAGRIDNVTVQGNLMEGNGYQLGLEQHTYGYHGVHCINNRFSGTGYGAAYTSGGENWSTWTDNYIYSAGAAEGRGTVVNRPGG